MKFVTFCAAIGLALVSSIPLATPASAQRQIVSESVTCESVGRERAECAVQGQIQDVQPRGSYSLFPCVFGFSWGYDERKIWVDKGCHAEFAVQVSRRAETATPQPQPIGEEDSVSGEIVTETLDCQSVNRGRAKCRVEGRIQDAAPVGFFSNEPCQLGTTWGFKNRHVWVDKGCHARFSVDYIRRNEQPSVAEPAPTPTPAPAPAPAPASGSGLAAAPANAVVAQGACSGLFGAAGQGGGYVFAVSRECSDAAPDCNAVCAGFPSTIAHQGWRKTIEERSVSCFNAVRVYDDGAAASVGAAGTKTYVYNDCPGKCGPNYCCCSAK